MTPPETRSTQDPNDPRLLLPEWLRDPGEPPAPDSSSNGSAGTAGEAVNRQTGAKGRAPESGAVGSWQQPPAARPGVYDPSMLIDFDDLPEWVQRLQEVDTGRSPLVEIQQSAKPAPVVGAAEVQDVERSMQAQAAVPDAVVVDDPEERVSDLSFTGFVWIAGTAIVLIIAAIVVLVG